MNFVDKLKELRRKIGFFYERKIVFFYQRMTRGWDDSEMWSLDHNLAKLILPRLKHFKEVRGGYPTFLSDKEWDEIIGKMVFAFEHYAGNPWDLDWKFTPEAEDKKKQIQEGLDLFAKYYGHLWT